MSETTHAAIRAPEDPIPSKFAEAYAELQAIAERLKPNTTKVPDVDEIEPLVAQELASHCEERIRGEADARPARQGRRCLSLAGGHDVRRLLHAEKRGRAQQA